MDLHIKSLRKKLGDRAGMSETVRSIGYRMRESLPTDSDKEMGDLDT